MSPKERTGCLRRARKVSLSSEDVNLSGFEWQVYKALGDVVEMMGRGLDGEQSRKPRRLGSALHIRRDGTMGTPSRLKTRPLPASPPLSLVTKGVPPSVHSM